MKTHILCSITFTESRTVYEIMSKNIVETEAPQMSQYGAYALRPVLVRPYACLRMHTSTPSGTHLHARTNTHTQANMWYLLLFHSNNGFVNVPQCYVIRTLPVLYTINVGRDCSVGVAIRYGLDDPGLECRWGPVPTQPPIEWAPCLFPGGKSAEA
jgi:hypothetical protein